MKPPIAAPIPTTVTCGQVITQSTLLANDLPACMGEGLIIGAPDIVLDLNGHTIRSGVPIELGEEDGLLAGIRNSGHRNVVIRNTNFGSGAYPTNPSPTFGQVTAVGDPRTCQLALRLRF